jgi:deazaflavin-dependent oxidoreductase (nitroreductase family)
MEDMKRFSIWKILKYPPQILYAIGLGSIYGRLVLLLTTTGRKSGLPRVTPLQYEEMEGKIVIASARGTKSDWYRNILVEPNVTVRVKSREFNGLAEPVEDPERVADYIEYRMRKHPRMIGFIMRREGFPINPTREDLVAYSGNRAVVIITPIAN